MATLENFENQNCSKISKMAISTKNKTVSESYQYCYFDELKKCSYNLIQSEPSSNDKELDNSTQRENESAKQSQYHENEILATLCIFEEGNREMPCDLNILNSLTVKAEVHEMSELFKMKTKHKMHNVNSQPFLGDCSIYSEEKIAKLASIDEIIEYEEEIANI